MLERRFFIPETAMDIFEVENSSNFCFIGKFDNGKIYHDITSENNDLYYIEHELMNKQEKEKYLELNA